jgi:uncharacterized HAD superfamily protein
MAEGKKYDTGKRRYDLIPALPLKDLADVYTFGATKYEDDNWRQGLKWTRIIGAMERHLQKFKNGQDVDEESLQYHLAHVAWGAFTLLEYSRTKVEFDDRQSYIPRMGYDIDGVVANICPSIKRECDEATPSIKCPTYEEWTEYSPENWDEIKNLIYKENKFTFLDSCEVFQHKSIPRPDVYITIRGDKQKTEAWFENHPELPRAPIVYVRTPLEKVEAYKEWKLDFFVEDSLENYKVMTAHGCNVLLVERPWNKDRAPKGVYINDLSEVEKTTEEIK